MTGAEVIARRDEARAYRDTTAMLVESADQADWKVAGANAVLGGIAAADAICGHLLGYRHAGEDHLEAKRLLDTACAPDRRPGTNLKRLLDEKTNFQYSSSRVTQSHTRQLQVQLDRLLDRMDECLAA